ncbi:MAG: hypothetical protein RR258_03310, partial [Alistipes sp.]
AKTISIVTLRPLDKLEDRVKLSEYPLRPLDKLEDREMDRVFSSVLCDLSISSRIGWGFPPTRIIAGAYILIVAN